MNIEDLQKKRDAHMTSFFWLGLQIAFIFGIPAAAAVLLGNYLKQTYPGGVNWTILFLFAAFVGSWIGVAVMYRKKSKILKEIESEIRELRIKEESNKAKEENK